MSKNKVLKQLNTVLMVRDGVGGGFGNTTNNVIALKGQAVFLTAVTTNFAVGDTVRVGSGDNMELGTISAVGAGASLTMVDNLTYDHPIGEACVEQVAYDLGDIAEGGVTVNASAQTTDVHVATKRLAYTILNGYTDLTAQFALPGVTLQNIAIALGIPLANVKGTGAGATPFSLPTDGNDFDQEQNQSLVAVGVTMDGSIVRVELWGIDVDYTGFQLALKRGNLASVPVKVQAAAGGVITSVASAYVANTTIRAVKGKVFDALTDVGLFVDTGTATTSTPAINAGDTALTVGASAGIVVDDWVRIDTGDVVEFHRVGVVPDGTHITLKTPVFRAHAAAVAIVKVLATPLGTVHEDGVQVAVSGSVDVIRDATKRISVGVKPGAAVINLSYGLLDFSLAVLARTLGIPAAQIVANRLPINSNIGTDIVQGAYSKGVLQSGETQWVNLWGCSQDVSGFAAQLNNTGISQLPIKFRPNTIHFIQHA